MGTIKTAAHGALVLALLVACVGPSTDSMHATNADSSQQGTISEPAVDANRQTPEPYALASDQFLRADSFWSAAVAIAELEVEHYSTLEEMTAAATAVIVGRVLNQVEGPTVRDSSEPVDAAYKFVGYEVDVLELLAGQLPVGGETIVLSTHYAPDVESTEPTLMFLRWRGEGYSLDSDGTAYDPVRDWDLAGYRLVSSQGLFIDSPSGAWNPVVFAAEGYTEDDPTVLQDPVARQAIEMSLSELIALVVSVNGD